MYIFILFIRQVNISKVTTIFFKNFTFNYEINKWNKLDPIFFKYEKLYNLIRSYL